MNIHITITTDDDNYDADELQALLAEALRRIDQARAAETPRAIETLSSDAIEIPNLTATVDELTTVLDERVSTNNNMRRSLADERQVSRSLRLQVGNHKAERARLATECDGLRRRIVELEQDKRTLEAELAAYTIDVTSHYTERDRVED